MNRLVLPRISGTREMPVMPEASQLTVIGGSGVGKTKFIEEPDTPQQRSGILHLGAQCPIPGA